MNTIGRPLWRRQSEGLVSGCSYLVVQTRRQPHSNKVAPGLARVIGSEQFAGQGTPGALGRVDCFHNNIIMYLVLGGTYIRVINFLKSIRALSRPGRTWVSLFPTLSRYPPHLQIIPRYLPTLATLPTQKGTHKSYPYSCAYQILEPALIICSWQLTSRGVETGA